MASRYYRSFCVAMCMCRPGTRCTMNYDPIMGQSRRPRIPNPSDLCLLPRRYLLDVSFDSSQPEIMPRSCLRSWQNCCLLLSEHVFTFTPNPFNDQHKVNKTTEKLLRQLSSKVEEIIIITDERLKTIAVFVSIIFFLQFFQPLQSYKILKK